VGLWSILATSVKIAFEKVFFGMIVPKVLNCSKEIPSYYVTDMPH
jgi:hypothetical protein